MKSDGSESSEELLNLDEAVQFLGTSKPTLYRLLGQGDLKGLKVGRQWRFRRADLVAYTERGEAADDPEIIGLAYEIVRRAINSHASDIHLEPREQDVLVRVRVDGLLREDSVVPKDRQQALIARLKIMADINPLDRGAPQEGRIPVMHQEKLFDLRVATIPSLYGEAVTVRILDPSGRVIGLDKLGLAPDDLSAVQGLLAQPNGLILVAGPGGSGRTTFLYSCLQAVAGPERRTLTIESPVESPLPHTTQVEAREHAFGLTHAAALRALLRQDPDVLMTDWLGDRETTHLAMEASLTGHLVLAQTTASDIRETLARLEEFGIEPHLKAATVTGIVGARLCRRNCNNCRIKSDVTAGELRRFGFAVENGTEVVTLERGSGCDQCRHRGYRGRIGLFEALRMTPEIADLLLGGSPWEDIFAAAHAAGMTTLREDGLRKVLAGETTPDEVMRALFTAM